MNTLRISNEDKRESAGGLDRVLLGIACWIPLIAFIALVAFAVIAAERVGHWPYYSNPDPKELRLPVLHAAALLSYPVALISIPACLLVVIIAWRSLRWRDIIA